MTCSASCTSFLGCKAEAPVRAPFYWQTPAAVPQKAAISFAPHRATAMVKGFGRRPLARGGARHGEAGVRKPSKEETAFRKRRWRRSHVLWGFDDRSLSAARS